MPTPLNTLKAESQDYNITVILFALIQLAGYKQYKNNNVPILTEYTVATVELK